MKKNVTKVKKDLEIIANDSYDDDYYNALANAEESYEKDLADAEESYEADLAAANAECDNTPVE